ncbi:MAG: hypothetical protein Q8P83_00170 [bacterium]|nr:hypothetical protein [bacterium]
MASKFIFIRHGQLKRPYQDHLTMGYDALADLALSRIDPELDENAEKLFIKQIKHLDFSGIKTIYYNNSGKQSKRSLESAQIIAQILRKKFHANVRLKGLDILHELNFNLRKLLSRSKFDQSGIRAVRLALFSSVVENQGKNSEPINSIEKRVIKIHSIISKYTKTNEGIIFVTHAFFMRFIQTYIKRTNRLKSLSVINLQRVKLNHYFGGFITDSTMRKIKIFGSK